MSPLLEKEDLKLIFMEYMSNHDGSVVLDSEEGCQIYGHPFQVLIDLLDAN
jgi:hypothetical protein